MTDGVKKKWEKEDEEANRGWVNYDPLGKRTVSNRRERDKDIRWTYDKESPPGSPFYTGGSKKEIEREIDSLRGRIPFMGKEAAKEANERVAHLEGLLQQVNQTRSPKKVLTADEIYEKKRQREEMDEENERNRLLSVFELDTNRSGISRKSIAPELRNIAEKMVSEGFLRKNEKREGFIRKEYVVYYELTELGERTWKHLVRAPT